MGGATTTRQYGGELTIVTVYLKEFINTIFDGITADERVCLTLPDSEGRWSSVPASPRRLERYTPGTGPWYFCISSVAPPSETGYLPRRHQDLRVCYCIVLDDVGTKAAVPPVAPSWVLESSAGNYQYGYLLDPIELTPEAVAYVEGCVRGLAVAGYSDPGAQGCYRVMRVPGSLHKTGFVAEVTQWAPERSWDLRDLMTEMGVEPLRQRVRRAVAAEPGEHTVLADVCDPVYLWLESQGMVLDFDADKVFIACPWVGAHTGGEQGAKSAAYWPANYGSSVGAGFKCLHGHCADRRLADLMTWVAHKKSAQTGLYTTTEEPK